MLRCCSGFGLPDNAGLEVGRSARENSGGQGGSRLTAVHHTLGHRGEGSRKIVLAKGFAAVARQGTIRGAVVNGGFVVRLVTSHCLSRALVADQGAARMGRCRSLGRVGLDARSKLGDKADIDGSDQASRPETSSTSNSEERHCV